MSEAKEDGDGVERWDFSSSWQGSTSPPHLGDDRMEEDWDTGKWATESRKLAKQESAEQTKRVRVEREGDEQDMKRSLNLMGLGTLFVVGAISANVFTFQRSRWAVGKEIHRAWQRRESYKAQQQARAASKAARDSKTSGTTSNTNTNTGNGGGFAHAAREAAARAAQAAARAAVEQAFRTASKHAEDAARRTRSRGSWQSYTQSWTNDGTGWRTTSSSENGNGNGNSGPAFDASDLDELLRQMRGERARGSKTGGRRDVDDLFEEMMRGLGGGRRGGNSANSNSSGNMKMDDMFEEMFRAARQASEAQGNRNRNFWESGGFGPGVHTRASYMGNGAHYKSLGLDNGADKKSVKAAYRKLAMKYHPDRYDGDDKERAANKFREITEAYEALTKGN